MSNYVMCPFFSYEKGNVIKCEGCRKVFNTKTEKSAIYDKYCTTYDYTECDHAKKLIHKYNSEGGTYEEEQRRNKGYRKCYNKIT